MIKTGKVYGKFYVMYQDSTDTWVCECSCGNIILLREQEIHNDYCERACLDTRGEECAEEILTKNNIQFETQKRFNDFDLAFDFYLPEYNCIIECDGAQHFRSINDWISETKLQETRKRDELKDKYCKEHNIKLIRIPFWDKEKLQIDYLKKVI